MIPCPVGKGRRGAKERGVRTEGTGDVQGDGVQADNA